MSNHRRMPNPLPKLGPHLRHLLVTTVPRYKPDHTDTFFDERTIDERVTIKVASYSDGVDSP